MCRLAAVVTKTEHRQNLKAVPTLLTSIMLENGRTSNKDGYGIGIPATGETFKEMTAVTTGLIAVNPIKWIWDHYKLNQVLIGHTRLSTTGKGKNDDRNAHPFVKGQWMLAHNGHFSNYVELARDLKVPEEVVVDSEIALWSLAETWGDKQTLTLEDIQAGLNKLEGSYALIIGNSYEPDKLYLIVGSNPLNVYQNDRFFVVNTDSQLLSYINQISWTMGIGYSWWQEFNKTELKTNHAYTLDRKELVDLGTFTPKVATRTAVTVYQPPSRTISSPNVGQSTVVSGASDSPDTGVEPHDVLDIDAVNLVEPAKAASQVARLELFLSSHSLTLAELGEMLVELPTIIPSSPWKLTEYDFLVLEGWFDFLKDQPYSVYHSGLMESRRQMWSVFKTKCGVGTDPYAKAHEIDPSFRVPYYLNTTTAISRLYGAQVVSDIVPVTHHGLVG